MPKFRDIEQFSRSPVYAVDIAWTYLDSHISSQAELGLDLNPDFQREHVWTRTQQTAFVEYVLRGGTSGNNLYFNHTHWNTYSNEGEYVIVDGKQRLQAVRQFMSGKISAFGYKISEYEDKPDIWCRFRWHVWDLPKMRDVYKFYLWLNTGGTPHKKVELDKVRAMLEAEEEAGKP